MGRSWTDEEDAFLAKWYGTWTPAQIGGALGRTLASVIGRAFIKGLSSPYPVYTAAELETVRDLWGRCPRAEIAAKLGRPANSVTKMARRLGLVGRCPRGSDPQFEARVRELHAAGWSDSEIAGDTGAVRGTVRKVRCRLGLPLNTNHPRQQEKYRVAIDKLRASGRGIWGPERPRGARHPHRLRREAYAEASGWPTHLGTRSVQALNILARAGVPLTRRELDEAAGIPADNRNNIHYALRELVKEGLVTALPAFKLQWRKNRWQPGTICQEHRQAYTLSPLALSILRERAQCKSNDETPR
jgi:hypothetical protein